MAWGGKAVRTGQRMVNGCKGVRRMKSFHFNPGQSFTEVRKQLMDLNHPDNKGMLAKLTWLAGERADKPLTYLWDPYAERFGHQIDKEMIDHQVVDSLINELSVEVLLVEPHRQAD